MHKVIILVGLAFCLAGGKAAAATVSVLVVESGLNDTAPIREYTYQWEDGIMGAFFDGGHIVSNAPILQSVTVSDGDIPAEASRDIQDALFGGADFFVLALLRYKAREGALPDKPEEVTLRLFRFGDKGTMTRLYDETFAPGTARTFAERGQDIKIHAGKLVPLVKNKG